MHNNTYSEIGCYPVSFTNAVIVTTEVWQEEWQLCSNTYAAETLNPVCASELLVDLKRKLQ